MPYVQKNAVLELHVKSLTVLLQTALSMLKVLRRSLHGREVDSETSSHALALAAQAHNLAEELGAADEDGGTSSFMGSTKDDPLSRIEQMRSHHYLTNDIVCIRGSYYGTRGLDVSGLERMKLGLRLYILLKVLARQARTAPGVFMLMNDLLDSVEQEATGITNPDGSAFWNAPAASDVHRLVSELRSEIERAGGNPNLVESSRNHGGGMRFSTPPWNIAVVDENGDVEREGEETNHGRTERETAA